MRDGWSPKRAASIAGANAFQGIAREWFLKFSARWAESHSSSVLPRLENDLFAECKLAHATFMQRYERCKMQRYERC
jgi:hypothetical protein